MAEYVKIYCCGDCGYYDWRKHKCSRGAKVDDGSCFFRDCPLGIHEEKDGEHMWIHKSDVTEEAIKAVIGHMYYEIPKGGTSFSYAVRLKDGKYARLKIEVTDECPEWAREQLEGKGGNNHEG